MPTPQIDAIIAALKSERPNEVQKAADAFLATLNPAPGHGFFMGLNPLVIAVRESGPQVGFTTPKLFSEAMSAAYDARFSDLGPDHRQEFVEATSNLAASWRVADVRDKKIAASSTLDAPAEDVSARRRRRPN